MAEHGSWPKIKDLGLLSTSALLDLYEIQGNARYEIESQQRRESVTIYHPKYGKAVIRDQKVLHTGALEKLVDGMSAEEYYRLLNGKTFFWARKERLLSLLNGRAYRGKTHDVLTIETDGLVKKHHNEITLSPINSGAIFGSGRRGSHTFRKIKEYPYQEMCRKKHEDAIVELVVDYAVKDISEFTVRVEEWKGSSSLQVIWKRRLIVLMRDGGVLIKVRGLLNKRCRKVSAHARRSLSDRLRRLRPRVSQSMKSNKAPGREA